MVTSEDTINYTTSIFHDIKNDKHLRQAIDVLLDGNIVAIECLGPFGLMIAIKKAGTSEETKEQITRLGEMKGRDMSDKPAPFFTPFSALDQVINYKMMTRGRWTEKQVKNGLKLSMLETGTFFEVALKREFAEIIPNTKTVTITRGKTKKKIKTAVVACVDKSYPHLAKIVQAVWRKGRIPLITSANRSNELTLTHAKNVWDTFKMSYPDLLVFDNPELKNKFKEWNLKQSSYTMVLFASGWETGFEHRIMLNRQGNVGPDWLNSLLRKGLEDIGLDIHTSKNSAILVEKPFFDIHKGPAMYKELETFIGALKEQKENEKK